ncbi:MAG: 3-phosphoglycerate dehydrogenase [Lachnospiraceae bacterium]|nr:3-phosphoglycerate dehydrogenase [Lachnospiraceae bacterium]
MFKYHMLNPIADIGIREFDNNYVACDDFSAADCALVRSADMHKLDIPKNLLAVGRAGAGVNNIPLEEYGKRGIVVFNTPGANANGVKELVLAGMFYASRGIFDGIEWLDNEGIKDPNVAKTAEKQKKHYAGTEISGKKLGVIGLGAIGVKVANAATNLGMMVYGYDPYISVDAAWHLSRSIKHVHQVEEIYANCDYITIHVPLLDSTRHMINADAIKLMKDTAILLNFARDELVDEESVVAALKVGKLRKYVSDFPNPTTVGKEGCIVTPHLGASTEESEENCAVMAVKQLRDYMENGNIKNAVNLPDIDMGRPETVSRILIFHNNVANVLTRLTSAFGDEGINIATMNSKSKGERAVTILDLDSPPTENMMKRVEQAKEVIRVRLVK